MGQVIVLGSLMMDLVARAPRLPAPGETIIGDELNTFLGGKGFNQAVAAARLGASVSLIGRVGMDDYGSAYFPALAAEHIVADCVERTQQAGTGTAVILVGEATGQNMIVPLPRANLTLTAHDIEAAFTRLTLPESAHDAVFLAQCEVSLVAVRAGLAEARSRGMRTILNVAPVPREALERAFFAHVDLLIPNEAEASALAGIAVSDPESAQIAAEKLLDLGPSEIVLTLGAQGYLWSVQEASGARRHTYQPALPAKAVDATAAGDAFCGALAAALAADHPMTEALRWANAAGAIAVSRQGALPSLPTAREVEELVKRFA